MIFNIKNNGYKVSDIIFSILDSKYFISILLFVVCILALIFNLEGGTGDYYHHAGVINELIQHPLHPNHPYYGTSDTTQYFTPYHLIVSIFANLFHINALYGLTVFSIINIILFILALITFSKTYYGSTKWIIVVVVLCLWWNKWGFSGEYSILILPSVSAYHSTFALSTMLFSLCLCIHPKLWKIILISILSTITILSQPITIFAMISGVVVFILTSNLGYKKRIIYLALYFVLLTLLLCLWPYYSFFDIVLSTNSKLVESSSKVQISTFPMYSLKEIIKVIWPILIICLFFIRDCWKQSKTLIIISCLIFIYYLLYIKSNNELTGRSLPILLLFILIALGNAIHSNATSKAAKRWIMIPLCILFMFNLLLSVWDYSKPDKSFIASLKRDLPAVCAFIDNDDIVLSDLNTSYHMLAYSGKAVATIFPQLYVKDDSQRKNDIDIFFSEDTTNKERQYIITKHKAKYILVDKSHIRKNMNEMFVPISKSVIDSIKTLGEPITETEQLILIKNKVIY